jgi:hypothetical protein
LNKALLKAHKLSVKPTKTLNNGAKLAYSLRRTAVIGQLCASLR